LDILNSKTKTDILNRKVRVMRWVGITLRFDDRLLRTCSGLVYIFYSDYILIYTRVVLRSKCWSHQRVTIKSVGLQRFVRYIITSARGAWNDYYQVIRAVTWGKRLILLIAVMCRWLNSERRKRGEKNLTRIMERAESIRETLSCLV